MENTTSSIPRMSYEYEKLMEKSVHELELTVRAANLLNNANIHTLKELCSHSEKDLLKFRNCGKVTIREIRTKLQELGLDLGFNENSTASLKLEIKFLKKQIETCRSEYMKIHDRFNIMSSLFYEMIDCKTKYRNSIHKFEEMMGRIVK